MASCKIESFLGNSHPVVLLPAHLKTYIEEIVEQCPDEVSWVMEVTEHDNFLYEIESVFIPPQKVNGATTEFEADDILGLLDAEPDFDPGKWRGWGHSHVNMGVNPSQQDLNMMLEFAESCDFFVGMIHNKNGAIFCWVVDGKRQMFFRDVVVQVESEYKNEVKELLKERVEKLVVKSKKSQGGKHNHNTNSRVSGTTGTTGNQIGGGGTIRYASFDCDGYKVCFSYRDYELPNGQTEKQVGGFEVEGVFFPQFAFKTAKLAVMAYEQMIVEQLQEADEIPPLHELDVKDELEDWHDEEDSIADTLLSHN